MGLFSKKEPVTKIGRYIERVGSWGLAFGALACVMLFGLVLEVHQALTMRAVTGQVVAVDEVCVLSHTDGKKRHEERAESCELAESMKAGSIDKLYEIERHNIITMSWPTLDNRIATRRLSPRESRPFKKKSVGDLVPIRVGEGKRPAVENRISLTTVAIFSGVIALIFWRIWPWKAERTGGAGIYVREGGPNSGFASRLREGVASLAVKACALSILGILFGGFLWFQEIKANWTYVEADARLTKVVTSCRLSYHDEDDKRQSSDSMTCDRADQIAVNDTNIEYSVNKKTTYHLTYMHPVAGETEVKKHTLRGNEADLNDIVPVLVNPDNPKLVQIVRQDKSFNAGKFVFWSSLSVANFSAWIAYFLGAYIVWPGQGRKLVAQPRPRPTKQQPSTARLQQIRSRRRPRVEP